MSGYFPAGVTQSEIDRAAGGYDPPRCECVYDPSTSELGRRSRSTVSANARLAAAYSFRSFCLSSSIIFEPHIIRNVKRICPKTGVVLMSAHIASEALPEYAAFISKPFRMTDLFSIVEKVLPDFGAH